MSFLPSFHGFLCGSYHLFPSISLHLLSSWEKESRSLRDPYIDYSLTRASAKDGDVFILSFDDDDIGQRKEEEELNKRSFHSPRRRFLSIHKKFSSSLFLSVCPASVKTQLHKLRSIGWRKIKNNVVEADEQACIILVLPSSP